MIRPVLMLILMASPAHATPAGIAAACTPEARQTAYNQGHVQGVEDIRAQLAAATRQMQQQVQDQVNAPLAEIQRQRNADLGTRMRAAQGAALPAAAAAAPMPPALTGGGVKAAPATGSRIRPARQPRRSATRQQPDDHQCRTPAARLPPGLYAALSAFMAR